MGGEIFAFLVLIWGIHLLLVLPVFDKHNIAYHSYEKMVDALFCVPRRRGFHLTLNGWLLRFVPLGSGVGVYSYII